MDSMFARICNREVRVLIIKKTETPKFIGSGSKLAPSLYKLALFIEHLDLMILVPKIRKEKVPIFQHSKHTRDKQIPLIYEIVLINLTCQEKQMFVKAKSAPMNVAFFIL
jgi:hypothetical protein